MTYIQTPINSQTKNAHLGENVFGHEIRILLREFLLTLNSLLHC